MRKFTKFGLAAAFAVSLLGVHAANAADLQGQYEAPPPQAYEPPPQNYGYAAPPPVAYGYPPPVAYYGYTPPPYVVVPPYFVGRPYWRGYAPRYAYGYGHWGHGYRRW